MFWALVLRQRENGLFLSDEGPTLETLDYTIRIGSTPTFLYSIRISTLPTQHTMLIYSLIFFGPVKI